MKIVIISDTHGDNRVIDQIIEEEEKEAPFEYLIHCGDSETSLKKYMDPSNPYKFLAVRGNCDFSSSLPSVLVERILFYNVFITHGHRENVSYGDHDLLETGLANRADIILYGHTHVPEFCERDGVLLINPGSPTKPRNERRDRTYAVLTLTEDYDRYVTIKVLR
ncbi:MAG: metallophosphoesterase [Lachnospiraceae bacterium]|nr:metallophosphoesterase [Lachnospiraceae bacterium]